MEAITPRTAERYGELLTNQMVPFIGDKRIQKLDAADIEDWHGVLKTKGSKGRAAAD